MRTEKKQLLCYLVALLPLSCENSQGTMWPWVWSWFTLLGHCAAECIKQWERKIQLLLIKCNVGAWFTSDLTIVAVSNWGCHPSWGICWHNSTAHVIKQYFLKSTHEITYSMYIAVKAKCKTCWLEHAEFDTNSPSSPNARLCCGQELRPLSIKGTIHKVPTARSPQLPLLYELTGLGRNSWAGEKICLFSLMDNFYEVKCLFWLQLSAHNFEQNKNFAIQNT